MYTPHEVLVRLLAGLWLPPKGLLQQLLQNPSPMNLETGFLKGP